MYSKISKIITILRNNKPFNFRSLLRRVERPVDVQFAMKFFVQYQLAVLFFGEFLANAYEHRPFSQGDFSIWKTER